MFSHFVAAVIAISCAAGFAPPASATDWTRPYGSFYAVRGSHLHGACFGSKTPALVFEHGMGTEGLFWLPLAEALKDEHMVCFYDRRGYGFNAPIGDDAEISAKDVVEDLDELVAAMSIPTPFVLVGHSLGGFYAAHYAKAHPEKLAGLVLFDPVLWHDRIGPFGSALTAIGVPFIRRLGTLIRSGLFRPVAPSTPSAGSAAIDAGLKEALTVRFLKDSSWSAAAAEVSRYCAEPISLESLPAALQVSVFWSGKEPDYEQMSSERSRRVGRALPVNHALHWDNLEVVVNALRGVLVQ